VVRLSREPIEIGSLQAAATSKDGAVCAFFGVVRRENLGRVVHCLEYESYEEMALAQMQALEGEIRRRWPVSEVTLIHRLGRLEVGEASVAVVVTTPHRAQAFEACRFAIDTIKKTVPIWKKEFYADGEVWIEGPMAPASEAPGQSNRSE